MLQDKLKATEHSGHTVKIVIVDAHTINPGDQSWDPLRQFGHLEIWERTAPNEAYHRCRDAEIVITSKVVFNRPLLERLPKLRCIAVIATGYNVTDLACARERGIVVTNVPDYCSNAVAQMVFAHMMELARRVGHHDASVKRGRWTRSLDFCYWDYPQVELSGKMMGLIGCGHIGRTVARIARALDMHVIAYDPFPCADAAIEFVDLDAVFRLSDVLSLHCPLTDATAGIINAQNLAKMKPSAFIINTSRGPLVREAELAKALCAGTIAGAGLDVLAIEPPEVDNPLFVAPNCFITPHVAWASTAARRRLIELTAENLRAFLAGSPVNVVNTK